MGGFAPNCKNDAYLRTNVYIGLGRGWATIMGTEGPGRSHCRGIGLLKLAQMFPDEDDAVNWFVAIFWPIGRKFSRCNATNTYESQTSGVESPWAVPKRACRSIFHQLSKKHINCCAIRFASRRSLRDLDAIAQMGHVAAATVRGRLMYKALTS